MFERLRQHEDTLLAKEGERNALQKELATLRQCVARQDTPAATAKARTKAEAEAEAAAEDTVRL